MGFFDKLFANNTLKDEGGVPWKPLLNTAQLEGIMEASKSKTQVIFKHSTRCGISSMVLRQFERAFDDSLQLDMYFLDLLQNRDVSNVVSEVFKVYHESPQLLIIKNGEVIEHASHGQINQVDLASYQV
ncbi:bacillithiol system redox-active protein YtxJ [Formosa sp. S-31]|uniref:bacillithiol system redox-active protein YtxJ n=1 Tax=Formosa sp. S-31 TaxID=2790949 RepID=UPI003EBF6AA9